MSIRKEVGAKEPQVGLPIIHPKPPRIEIIKKCEKPAKPPHPSEIIKAEKTPWDEGLKLSFQRKYLCNGDYEIREYSRLLPKKHVETYNELVKKLKETLSSPAYKREPHPYELIHAALLATEQSMTPTLLTILTGLSKEEVAQTLYRYKDKFLTMPSTYLPHILAESQFALRRYVKPKYYLDEILGKPIPPEAVTYTPLPLPPPKKEYITLEEFMPKPPPPAEKPAALPPLEAPALPFAATRPPYTVTFKDNKMFINWHLPSRWRCLIGNHEFITWYPPQCPRHPEAKFPETIQYLHVVTPEELKTEEAIIHPLVVPSIKYLPAVVG